MEVSESHTPSAERDIAPAEYDGLNLEVFSDEQIMRMAHMFGAEFDERAEALPDAEVGVADDLWLRLGSNLEVLLARDPERSKRLLGVLKNDVEEHGKWLAAEWAPYFVPLDYELARDTLVDLARDDSRGDFNELSDVITGANIDFRRFTTPEQYRDYERRSELAFQGRDSDLPVSEDAYRSGPGPAEGVEPGAY